MSENDPHAVTGEFGCEDSTSVGSKTGSADIPQSIGRYRIERLLGEGGFGVVYLATDPKLDRRVALKVPHPRLVATVADADAYLNEARTVANLDHPHIVPVYDVGSAGQYPCFIVGKYVEGSDLARRIRQGRLSVPHAAQLVATMATALHHAHKLGIVHRDVKPGNILLDNNGNPFLVDFGLALREENVGQGPRYAGTAAYMSPEQARGEGHRVDGRSDIFSLGVVLYELLVGRRPFRADTEREVLTQVSRFEPRPPRQLDDTVPKDLERICLKAISKLASERYTTAKDLADELQAFLDEQTLDERSALTAAVSGRAEERAPTRSGISSEPSRSAASRSVASWDSRPVHIVPQGLRSFTAHDADFFLELLPGARDRNGLPDSIRFWKSRIEETDADETFSVGLLYGPSGCGKSSLVKAGLVPHLDQTVLPIYIEATADETESRLLQRLQKQCPELNATLDLRQAMSVLRRGQGVPSSTKVLIMLDQFEQWLHAHRSERDAELVQALRQCDGGRLQCILMVRDDFWMAATRVMRELEVRLLEGENSAAVDLFQPRHATKVLAAFGRAYGDLPNVERLNREQRHFVDQAVRGLTVDGKVICVRLALFAEMIKGKPWTPATLKILGGTEGVGVAFLEEAFSSSTAPPEHRYHQQAARSVLRCLLPDAGTDIKGAMQSYNGLLVHSGYANRPEDFERLLEILDTTVRFITPTDPDGMDLDENLSSRRDRRQRHYQLTHDYLVPALREWLTRKQRETRRGRAELRLAELSSHWNAKPDRRRLPGYIDWLRILLLTSSAGRTEPQRKMLRAATRTYGWHAVCLISVLSVCAAIGWQWRGQSRANALIEKLQTAEIEAVQGVVDELEDYRRWAVPELKELVESSPADSRERLNASLALLPSDAMQGTYLRERMLIEHPDTVLVIRDALQQNGFETRDWLWGQLSDRQIDAAARLRAAVGLASLGDPTNSEELKQWKQHAEFVAAALVDEANTFPSHFTSLTVGLRPARAALIAPLRHIYREGDLVRRKMATGLLADYAVDDASALSNVVMDGDETQFQLMYPLIDRHADQASRLFNLEVAKSLDLEDTDAAKETLAKRQANAAVALLLRGKPENVWSLFQHRPDPRTRSFLIHRLEPLGVSPRVLWERFRREADVSARRALLQALGQYDAASFSEAEQGTIISEVDSVFETDPDPGLHASAEWLLCEWGQTDRVKNAEQQFASGSQDGFGWYINSAGHTMIIVDGTDESAIGRRFAIAGKEVTLQQLQEATPRHRGNEETCPTFDCPAGVVTWFHAIAYCQWLNEQEGIPEDQWCYPKFDYAAEGLPRYETDLSRTGYRLPTSAEWVFACLGGSTTTRHYGQSDDLLANYAWYADNSALRSWPVGSLQPNDFGLFDMHGNIAEWCTDHVFNDRVHLSAGAYGSDAEYVTADASSGALPRTKYNSFGFRIVRTHVDSDR